MPFLSSKWCHCPCNNGIVALDLQQCCCPWSATALLPFLQWHCCHTQASVIALIAMALLSSLVRRHPCWHCNGVVALIAMALLLLMCRRLCCHCNGDCRSCCNDVSTIVKLAWSSSWCCCPCNNEVVAVINAHASLLSSRSPLSCWCCCPQYASISVLVARASLPLLCFCFADNSQASSPLLSWHILSRQQRGRPRRRQRQHQRNKGNNASTTWASMPAEWGWWCQHKEGDNASAVDDASMMRANASTTRATTWARW